MSLADEIKRLTVELAKSRDLKHVELNGSMSADSVSRMLKDVTDHAKAKQRSKRVVIVSFTQD